MSSLLNSTAVGRRTGGDAGEILTAYIATAPMMAQNHTVDIAPTATAQPKGNAVGDQFEPR